MKLTISRSKNSVSFYVSESFRDKFGHSTTRTVMKLGTEKSIKEKYGEDFDVEAWARAYVQKLNDDAAAKKPIPIVLELPADVSYDKGEARLFNVGYLALQKVLYSIGLKEIIKSINSRTKIEFDLEKILADLVYARILEPNSKLGSYEYCKEHLLESPEYDLHQIYRALDVIANEADFIQSSIYKNSTNVASRNTSVLFYDCTNFYFEISNEDDLRKFGKSKENRPNPIVQMGMFIDGNGIPLGFSIFPGNQNEQLSLKPLEQTILNDYGMDNSKLIVCTDAGLASAANRRLNCVNNREFIVTQPIKTMAEKEQCWVLDHGRSLLQNPIREDENAELVINELSRNGWHCSGTNTIISLDDIDETDPTNFNKIYYKEKYLVDEKSKLEQRIIVTYSIKYKHFMEKKRIRDIERAKKLIITNNSKKIEIKGQNDVRKYIQSNHTTKLGEKAENTSYALNDEEIQKQAKYEGFYAVCTSIDKTEMSVEEIIRVNKGRWEIEESFMLMKTEFKSRPVYVYNEERIKAHFVTCFMALLVYRILEQKILAEAKEPVTAPELIKTLREMQITNIGKYYTGSFKRTDLTDLIQAFGDFKFDCNLITPSKIKGYIKNSKKVRKV